MTLGGVPDTEWAHIHVWQHRVESVMRLVLVVPFPALALAFSLGRCIDDE